MKLWYIISYWKYNSKTEDQVFEPLIFCFHLDMHAIYIKNSSIFYKNGIWQIVQSTNSMGSHQIAVFNVRSSPQIVGGPRQRVVLTLHAFTGWLI